MRCRRLRRAATTISSSGCSTRVLYSLNKTANYTAHYYVLYLQRYFQFLQFLNLSKVAMYCSSTSFALLFELMTFRFRKQLGDL